MEGQKRNTAQLERIGAVMEWRWGSEEESGNRDEEEGSEDGPGESQEGRLYHLPPVRLVVLSFLRNRIYFFYELNV